jgi:hypothetical protein
VAWEGTGRGGLKTLNSEAANSSGRRAGRSRRARRPPRSESAAAPGLTADIICILAGVEEDRRRSSAADRMIPSRHFSRARCMRRSDSNPTLLEKRAGGRFLLLPAGPWKPVPVPILHAHVAARAQGNQPWWLPLCEMPARLLTVRHVVAATPTQKASQTFLNLRASVAQHKISCLLPPKKAATGQSFTGRQMRSGQVSPQLHGQAYE